MIGRSGRDNFKPLRFLHRQATDAAFFIKSDTIKMPSVDDLTRARAHTHTHTHCTVEIELFVVLFNHYIESLDVII